MEGLLKTCDICYKEITNKVSLDCGHELCVMCFLEIMGMIKTFKCHMCRRYYVWRTKKAVPRKTLEVTPEEIPEETLSLLIREDDENQFRTLIGMETSRAFEVIVSINNNSFVSNPNQNVIQFIVILGGQIDTETLKFLISEFVANNIPFLSFIHDDLIQSLRSPAAFSHFKNTGSHLEAFYNNLVIKKYEE